MFPICHQQIDRLGRIHVSRSPFASFGPQHDMLAFTAKGTDTTRQVAVEIQERDGSRWFATADIGPQWKRICLDPGNFTYWRDSPTGDRRGRPGDRLQPAEEPRIGFQLSQSHTPAAPPAGTPFGSPTSEHVSIR